MRDKIASLIRCQLRSGGAKKSPFLPHYRDMNPQSNGNFWPSARGTNYPTHSPSISFSGTARPAPTRNDVEHVQCCPVDTTVLRTSRKLALKDCPFAKGCFIICLINQTVIQHSQTVSYYPTLIVTSLPQIVHLQFWANFDPRPKGGRKFPLFKRMDDWVFKYVMAVRA